MSQKLVVLGGSLAPATIAHLAILNSDPYVLRKLKRILPEPQAQFFANYEQISSTMIRTFAKNHDYESIQQYSNPVAAKLIKERKFSL